MLTALAPAFLALLALGALAVDVRAYIGLVILVGFAVLIDFSGLLGATGRRPVVITAAVAGVALPVSVVGQVTRAEGLLGWEQIPAYVAAAFVLTAVVLLASGRRHRVVEVIGATGVVVVVVGLGATGLLLLSALPQGFRWVVALTVMVAVTETAGVLTAALRSSGPDVDRVAQSSDPTPAALASVAAAVVVAGACAVLLSPPFELVSAALLAGIVLLAVLGGRALIDALLVEAAGEAPGTRYGVVLGLSGTLLLAAPAVYALARAGIA